MVVEDRGEDEPLHVDARRVKDDAGGLWMDFLVDEVGFRCRLKRRRAVADQHEDEQDDDGAG